MSPFGEGPREQAIDPQIPIVDPHHHLWVLTEARLGEIERGESVFARGLAPIFRGRPRYTIEELLADLRSGHDVRATVAVEAGATGSMYRARGPEELRSVGEVEYITGAAAMAASGMFGDLDVAAGIVGNVELRSGEASAEVLEAHIRAGGGRYRGVRSSICWDGDQSILGAGQPHVTREPGFRAGFALLEPLGLCYDAFVFEPQIPDVIDLARDFPRTQIVLEHVGTPLGVAAYAGRREERFPIWRENMELLADCENVAVKLGGLASPVSGLSYLAEPPPDSERLAAEWRPYIETAIELFGAERCMFESDFPVGLGAGPYTVVWNAFKRLSRSASPAERDALFAGTATRVYRLER
ncbi:MAG TPA: amidohydrolase family protein [Solirubrobacteraceae bacterium]